MIGNNIKNLRKSKKLTQDELAEKLNVTRQCVSSWENNKTQPDIETLHSIAAAMETSIDEIIYGKKRSHIHIGIIKKSPQEVTNDCISIGIVLATVISYVKWQSIGWALLHGALNWIYVIYYIIKYGWS
jgi:transcriptional regulator with XRE-family HTH domain